METIELYEHDYVWMLEMLGNNWISASIKEIDYDFTQELLDTARVLSSTRLK